MALNIPEQGVLGHFFRHALRGEDLEVFGDGLQLRDPVYVDDLVDVFRLAGERKGLEKTTMNAEAIVMKAKTKKTISNNCIRATIYFQDCCRKRSREWPDLVL